MTFGFLFLRRLVVAMLLAGVGSFFLLQDMASGGGLQWPPHSVIALCSAVLWFSAWLCGPLVLDAGAASPALATRASMRWIQWPLRGLLASGALASGGVAAASVVVNPPVLILQCPEVISAPTAAAPTPVPSTPKPGMSPSVPPVPAGREGETMPAAQSSTGGSAAASGGSRTHQAAGPVGGVGGTSEAAAVPAEMVKHRVTIRSTPASDATLPCSVEKTSIVAANLAPGGSPFCKLSGPEQCSLDAPEGAVIDITARTSGNKPPQLEGCTTPRGGARGTISIKTTESSCVLRVTADVTVTVRFCDVVEK